MKEWWMMRIYCIQNIGAKTLAFPRSFPAVFFLFFHHHNQVIQYIALAVTQIWSQKFSCF